jgi:hypothetical protein
MELPRFARMSAARDSFYHKTQPLLSFAPSGCRRGKAGVERGKRMDMFLVRLSAGKYAKIQETDDSLFPGFGFSGKVRLMR